MQCLRALAHGAAFMPRRLSRSASAPRLTPSPHSVARHRFPGSVYRDFAPAGYDNLLVNPRSSARVSTCTAPSFACRGSVLLCPLPNHIVLLEDLLREPNEPIGHQIRAEPTRTCQKWGELLLLEDDDRIPHFLKRNEFAPAR